MHQELLEEAICPEIFTNLSGLIDHDLLDMQVSAVRDGGVGLEVCQELVLQRTHASAAETKSRSRLWNRQFSGPRWSLLMHSSAKVIN